VVRALLDAGARPAEPGEFTLRAFLNGKLDLAQAEAVADLISAKTADAYRIARLQQQGVLSHKVTSLRDRLLGHLAAIEAVIDFPEDVSEPDYALISTDCDLIDGELRSLAATAEFGRIYRDGVRIVLAGEPNVGKSSLMNALLRHNRAIVTAVPGTTRDVIEEEMNLRGFPVVLIDTAGLRYTQDEVEKIGVQRTHDALDAADLTLAVLDASQPKSSLAALSANADLGPNAIVVWNKSDIAEECCDRASGVCVSAVTGDGLDDLEAMIASRLRNRSGERTDGIVVSRVRHQQVLLRAARCCHEAVQTIAQAMPPDFVSIDLHGALTALGEITGETTHDDIIAEIFSRFCIGK
jgi:tRNA modification GTPase